jgi:hypothetical protein
MFNVVHMLLEDAFYADRKVGVHFSTLVNLNFLMQLKRRIPKFGNTSVFSLCCLFQFYTRFALT